MLLWIVLVLSGMEKAYQAQLFIYLFYCYWNTVDGIEVLFNVDT